MSFESGMYLMETGFSEVVGSLVSMALSSFMSFGMSILAYVFTALSLYTIAQRRGIKNPWMAWVPVLNAWILGSISDQYRYVVKGQIRNRRKVLVALNVLQVLAVVVSVVVTMVPIVDLIINIAQLESMQESAIAGYILKKFLPLIGAGIVMFILAVVSMVFGAMSYYDVFASCDPDNRVLFLVLGLLIRITMPIFLFLCRKQDGGMPPRKEDAQPVYIAEPVATVEE